MKKAIVIILFFIYSSQLTYADFDYIYDNTTDYIQNLSTGLASQYNSDGVSYLGEDLGLNLYKNIDEGFEALERKNYEYELTGGKNSISEFVNEYIKNQTRLIEEGTSWDCIDKDLSVSDFDAIASGNISLLAEKISEDCKGEDKNIALEKITKIQGYINHLQSLAKQQSEKKSQEIHQISRIGLYSDGITQNSSFDLIEDLQAINNIIFSEEIPYEGSDYENLNDYFDSHFALTERGNIDTTFPHTNLSTIKIKKPENGKINNENTPNHSNAFQGLGESQYVCRDENNEASNLSSSEINKIVESIQNEGGVFQSNHDIEDLNFPVYNQVESNRESKSVYTPVNDNGVWPCDNFFCITVEFITYNHQLLGGGPDVSIEYLINRSNKHLKKFVNTSLVQANMTNNNFELGLKDLNLPDIFHLSVQIQSKPVPLLDIQLHDKEEENDKLTSKNMLEEYYKSLDLEYERRNDLSILHHRDFEKKSVIDSLGLTNAHAAKRLAEYLEGLEERSQQVSYNPQFVDKFISYDEMDRFGQQFLELERFANSIFEYTVSINSIIRKMNEIPVDPS